MSSRNDFQSYSIHRPLVVENVGPTGRISLLLFVFNTRLSMQLIILSYRVDAIIDV